LLPGRRSAHGVDDTRTGQHCGFSRSARTRSRSSTARSCTRGSLP